jgi:hypothetical protein
MTALNTFVQNYIPADIRQGRDFTGSRGWVYLMNQLLRRLETEGFFSLDQRKEVGVEVSNYYWITPPSDFKIYDPFDKKETPDSFTLSLGSTTQVTINDSDAEADQWEKYLLVLTNGTYSGDSILIGRHDAATAGLVALNFLHTRLTSIVSSTAGYLTDEYLMLKYMAVFAGLTTESSVIPVDAKYEQVLANGLCFLAKPIGSKDRKAYRDDFEFELDALRNELFTPTPDQARPQARPMAAYEDCESYDDKISPFEVDTW